MSPSGVPRESAFEVVRASLDEPIESLARGELRSVAVWAAAGSGKSVLLAHWARLLEERGERVRWIDGASLTTALSEERHRTERPIYLFVDDAHTLRSATAKARLAAVMEGPGQVRAVVAGRYQPVAGLAYLQASGDLVELRTEDLAFEREDAKAFASRHGVEMSDAVATALLHRTGGWATALALAMPWLARSTDVEAAVREFSGDDSAVADFLLTEVLAAFDDDTREVLTAAAVAEYVPTELAVAVAGSDAEGTLHRVAATNALLMEDAHGFRFHTVLLAFLQAEARRLSRTAATRAHAVAAEWFVVHEQPAAALRQAIAASDLPVLTEILERVGLELTLAGRSRLVAAALSRFAAEDEQPLSVIVLRLLLDAPAFADPRRTRHLLALAERAAASPSAEPCPWTVILDALRCFSDARDGSPSAGVARLTTVAAQRCREADLGLDLLCAMAEGRLLALIGEAARAQAVMRDVRVSAYRAGLDWLFLVASELSIGILSDLGRWDEAVVIEDKLVDAADRFSAVPHDRARRRVEVIAAMRRYLHCVENDAFALRDVAASDPLGLDPELSTTARIIELLPELDRARNPRRALDEIERLMRETGLYVSRVFALAAPRMVATRLALDGRARAKETAELVSSVLGPDGVETAIARFVLSSPLRNTEPVARGLEEALGAGRARHPASFVTAELLLAHSAEENGRHTDADQHVQHAVELAVRYRVERPFLAPAVNGIHLVSSRLGRFGHLDDDARRIVACAPTDAADGSSAAALAESLTVKEREILLELPVHQSVAEIARKHALSVNTVKTHLRNIYQKLGVSDRGGAVDVAQGLGLL